VGNEEPVRRKGKGGKKPYKYWRAGRLVVVTPTASPQVRASRRAASASLATATAKAVRREAETGADESQIATRLGISEAAVRRHLAAIAKTEPRPTVPRKKTLDNAPVRRRISSGSARRQRQQQQPKKTKKGFPRSKKSPKKLVPSVDSAKAEAAKRRRFAEEERHASRLRPVPTGESELELLAKKGELAAALERIDHLTHRKDDPAAWRDLALGYRSQALRRPVGDALIVVGPDKVLRLISERPSPLWGDEVVVFLEREIVDRKTSRPLRRDPLPHERPSGVWWED
jgi:predicted transcriptional regulator